MLCGHKYIWKYCKGKTKFQILKKPEFFHLIKQWLGQFHKINASGFLELVLMVEHPRTLV